MPERNATSLVVGPEGAALSQGLRIAVHDDRNEQLTARSFVVGDDPDEWPSSYSLVGAYPRARSRVHSLQGITHDERYWYIAWGYYTTRLSRIPIGADLAIAEPELTVDESNWFGKLQEIAHYDHFGALHHFDGLLYMAVDLRDHSGPPLLVKFDPGSLMAVQYGAVHPTQLNAGWAAVIITPWTDASTRAS
jgi:hypothetical protein